MSKLLLERSPSFCVLVILSCLALFAGILTTGPTALKRTLGGVTTDKYLRKKNDTTAVMMKSAQHFQQRQRSNYGYHRPKPPYQPVQHVSHTCVINRNTSSEQVIHLPTAVPHLILIGAQKSATSEFRALADLHINAITPQSVGLGEPHFLEGEVEPVMELMRKGHNNEAEVEDALCRFRQKYTEVFDMNRVNENAMIVAMEKTPRYMLYSNLPVIIDALCPWKPKILTILRDPVDRAWSHYRMDVKKSQNHKMETNITSFATRVTKEIDDFVSNGLLDVDTMSLQDFEASLATNNSDVVPPSPFVFPKDITIEKYAQLLEDYKESKRGHLIRGLYAPLLLPWVTQFAPDDRLMVMKFKEMWNETFVDDAFRFAGVQDTSIDEQKLKKNKNRASGGNANNGIEMSLDPAVRIYLQFLYQPFNRLLAQLLGEEWEGWGEYTIGIAEDVVV